MRRHSHHRISKQEKRGLFGQPERVVSCPCAAAAAAPIRPSLSTYFLAVISALTTKSSAPLPGSHCFITSRLSSLSLTSMSVNPASFRYVSRDSISGAPVTQQANASAVLRRSGIIFSGRTTTSDIATRPPTLRMRWISRNTCALSGLRLMTQLLTTQSTVPSATGRCSISPRRNSTLVAAVEAEAASVSPLLPTRLAAFILAL
mmetsp:Transcript_16856/g.36622  ORF Transcript_16856/g.36622 Transcript_16856/m.36622 type:complete len:204 (+) Transcript_16856:218-829(+)